MLILRNRTLHVGRLVFPCTIGRGGIRANKTEGDSATPADTLTVTGLLYRPDRIERPAPWAEPCRLGSLWSDDPADPQYNHLVRAPHSYRHERLWRADPLYDLVILTDWNWPNAVPGRGSAIFIHQWRRPGYPTEGCIALSRAALHRLAPVLPPGTRIRTG